MKHEQILKMVQKRRKHGLQLLVPENNVEELADRLLRSGSNHALLDEIRAEAGRMVQESDPELTYSLFRKYKETGERLTYERVYFERRKRLNAFVIMTMLEPDNTDYRNALHNTVWSICNEYTWCLPAHFNADSEQPNIDLFAAETGFALSEALVILGAKLPDLLRKRIEDEVELRLLRPFLDNGPYGWEKAEHNWAAVCAGSIGAAAIHLIDDEVRLSGVVERVLEALDCYLSGFGDDGACAEGYMYWQYGFGYYVYFAQLLKAATDGELNLFEQDKVKQIALFQQKCFTGGNTVVNFSDSMSESGIFMGLSCYLHSEYEEVVVPDASLRASYTADHCGRWAPAIRNLFWVKEEGLPVGEGKPIWPAESYYLPDVQWFISRHISAAGGSYSFAAKGGHNDEPHNHNDVGHFLVHADGQAYLADLGSGMYTAQYFGPERYELWCNGSQGHSVPIIGEQHQHSGKQFRASVKEAFAGEHYDQFVLDMGAAYENQNLGKLERRLHWSKEGLPALTLTDTIVFTEEGVHAVEQTVVERFITYLAPDRIQEGQIVLRGKRQLSILYDALAWDPVITARTDIDHFGRERSWYTLDFKNVNRDKKHIDAHFIFQFDS